MAIDPKMSGSFEGPPPGAPVAQSDHTIVGDVSFAAITDKAGNVIVPARTAVEQARQFEQVLPAFAPKPMTDEQIKALIGKTPDQIKAEIAAKSGGAMPAAGAGGAMPAASRPTGLVDPTGQPVSSNNGIAIPTSPAPAVTSSMKPVDIPRRIRRRPGMEVPKGDVVPVEPLGPTAAAAAGDGTGDVTAGDHDLPTGAASESAPVAAAAVVDAGAAVGEHSPGAPDVKPEPYRPAASDTDTPSRGLPTHAQDLGKRITGGWGAAGDAQYFPLNGAELCQLVLGLMDQIAARLEDDLRFSIAAVYPRVNARVVIEVECLAYDQSFQVKRVMPPHEKTPLAIARERADECVFVVMTERVESLPDGTPVVAPNQTRIDLGIQVPRKQAVATPAGRMIVDTKQE